MGGFRLLRCEADTLCRWRALTSPYESHSLDTPHTPREFPLTTVCRRVCARRRERGRKLLIVLEDPGSHNPRQPHPPPCITFPGLHSHRAALFANIIYTTSTSSGHHVTKV